MSRHVEFSLHAEQNETTSRLVLHIEGDPPITIAEYDRQMVERCGSVALIRIDGEGATDGFTGIAITLNGPQSFPAAMNPDDKS